MTSPEQLGFDATAAPIIVGYVMLVKKQWPKSWTKLLPAVAAGLGMIYAILYRPGCHMDVECIVAGFMVGLTATGMHGATKSAWEKKHT